MKLDSLNNLNGCDTKPWWKYGFVWLLISGPLIVVIAGIVTAYIAFSGADVIVDENYYQKGLEKSIKKSHSPAQTMRNHAVTPDGDLPQPQPD